MGLRKGRLEVFLKWPALATFGGGKHGLTRGPNRVEPKRIANEADQLRRVRFRISEAACGARRAGAGGALPVRQRGGPLGALMAIGYFFGVMIANSLPWVATFETVAGVDRHWTPECKRREPGRRDTIAG